jgi:hypothetical protein
MNTVRMILPALAIGFSLGLAPRDAHAHHSGFGFFQYRHSLNRWDHPHYAEYRADLDRRLHVAFHHMSPQTAHDVWHRGIRPWRRDRADDSGGGDRAAARSDRGRGRDRDDDEGSARGGSRR